MKKLSIKNIIVFKRKSEKSKKKFVVDLKVDKEKANSEGGGDYWVSSLSAISNSYKSNDLQFINNKTDELEEKLQNSENKKTKSMYQRNIEILYNSENFDFKKWIPAKKVLLIKKLKVDSVLTIEGLEIQASPNHVFSFKRNDVEEVGAIWFIAKLGGYNKDELGMFTDMLFRYLKINFSKKYKINPDYCIAVDVVNNFDVNYPQIQKADVAAVLTKTINEMKKLM